jgi:hypothetical protein
MRQELKAGTIDLMHLPLETIGPRQTRKLSRWSFLWNKLRAPHASN